MIGRLLNKHDVANTLGVSQRAVSRLVREKRLTIVQVPHDSEPKFLASDVEAFVHECRQQAAATAEGAA